jgi:hypothetical protein
VLGLATGRIVDTPDLCRAEWRSSGHRSDIELAIIEQRQMDLVAHRSHVGLLKEEFGGPAPARSPAPERESYSLYCSRPIVVASTA